MLEKAVNDTTAYMTSSLFNCVRGVVTAMQLTSLFPHYRCGLADCAVSPEHCCPKDTKAE